MQKFFSVLIFLILLVVSKQGLVAHEPILLGVDTFFEEGREASLKGKRVGLVINQTSYNRSLQETYQLFKEKVKVVALFCPEHGIKGVGYASEQIQDEKTADGLPIYSLHGSVRRPTEAMLKNIDVLIFDMQEIGCRSYTYATTLYYLMEEAAKEHPRDCIGLP
ncbi:MAG: DUF1343 domain-containing protein [Rhabdochlamydiaceae bacterium]|jgi:uncharacterized protein YbbC (DUF1343 family)